MHIAAIAALYVLSVAVGIGMVNARNEYALAQRDATVGAAQGSDILVAYKQGAQLRAAALDFSANLTLGAVTSTIAGISVVGLVPLVIYRGWIGGIVSVDAHHTSRLADAGEAVYYLVTLLLQLIPYSIAGGVGLRLGIGAWRQTRGGTAPSWLGLPKDLVKDAARAYVLIVPLFFIASLWEFFA